MQIKTTIRYHLTPVRMAIIKKNLDDPDNHDGLNTHLELDILECKIKWALGSIPMNKASGGDGIPGDGAISNPER